MEQGGAGAGADADADVVEIDKRRIGDDVMNGFLPKHSTGTDWYEPVVVYKEYSQTKDLDTTPLDPLTVSALAAELSDVDPSFNPQESTGLDTKFPAPALLHLFQRTVSVGLGKRYPHQHAWQAPILVPSAVNWIARDNRNTTVNDRTMAHLAEYLFENRAESGKLDKAKKPERWTGSCNGNALVVFRTRAGRYPICAVTYQKPHHGQKKIACSTPIGFIRSADRTVWDEGSPEFGAVLAAIPAMCAFGADQATVATQIGTTNDLVPVAVAIPTFFHTKPRPKVDVSLPVKYLRWLIGYRPWANLRTCPANVDPSPLNNPMFYPGRVNVCASHLGFVALAKGATDIRFVPPADASTPVMMYGAPWTHTTRTNMPGPLVGTKTAPPVITLCLGYTADAGSGFLGVHTETHENDYPRDDAETTLSTIHPVTMKLMTVPRSGTVPSGVGLCEADQPIFLVVVIPGRVATVVECTKTIQIAHDVGTAASLTAVDNSVTRLFVVGVEHSEPVSSEVTWHANDDASVITVTLPGGGPRNYANTLRKRQASETEDMKPIDNPFITTATLTLTTDQVVAIDTILEMILCFPGSDDIVNALPNWAEGTPLADLVNAFERHAKAITTIMMHLARSMQPDSFDGIFSVPIAGTPIKIGDANEANAVVDMVLSLAPQAVRTPTLFALHRAAKMRIYHGEYNSVLVPSVEQIGQPAAASGGAVRVVFQPNVHSIHTTREAAEAVRGKLAHTPPVFVDRLVPFDASTMHSMTTVDWPADAAQRVERMEAVCAANQVRGLLTMQRSDLDGATLTGFGIGSLELRSSAVGPPGGHIATYATAEQLCDPPGLTDTRVYSACHLACVTGANDDTPVIVTDAHRLDASWRPLRTIPVAKNATEIIEMTNRMYPRYAARVFTPVFHCHPGTFCGHACQAGNTALVRRRDNVFVVATRPRVAGEALEERVDASTATMRWTPLTDTCFCVACVVARHRVVV